MGEMRKVSSRAGRFPSFLLLAILLAAGCASVGVVTLPKSHPEDLGRRNPVCSSCHGTAEPIAYADFDHRSDWVDAHRYPAFGEGERVCAMCHRPNFCNDCHTVGSELSPAVRRAGEVGRDLPHRGDYLTRHRFDGRVDPASCFRCHGSPKTSKTCAACHG
jgi:hypothetical protein